MQVCHLGGGVAQRIAEVIFCELTVVAKGDGDAGDNSSAIQQLLVLDVCSPRKPSKS